MHASIIYTLRYIQRITGLTVLDEVSVAILLAKFYRREPNRVKYFIIIIIMSFLFRNDAGCEC